MSWKHELRSLNTIKWKLCKLWCDVSLQQLWQSNEAEREWHPLLPEPERATIYLLDLHSSFWEFPHRNAAVSWTVKLRDNSFHVRWWASLFDFSFYHHKRPGGPHPCGAHLSLVCGCLCSPVCMQLFVFSATLLLWAFQLWLVLYFKWVQTFKVNKLPSRDHVYLSSPITCPQESDKCSCWCTIVCKSNESIHCTACLPGLWGNIPQKQTFWWNVVDWQGVGLVSFVFILSQFCIWFSGTAKVGYKFGISGKCLKQIFGKDLASFMCNQVTSFNVQTIWIDLGAFYWPKMTVGAFSYLHFSCCVPVTVFRWLVGKHMKPEGKPTAFWSVPQNHVLAGLFKNTIYKPHGKDQRFWNLTILFPCNEDALPEICAVMEPVVSLFKPDHHCTVPILSNQTQ